MLYNQLSDKQCSTGRPLIKWIANFTFIRKLNHGIKLAYERYIHNRHNLHTPLHRNAQIIRHLSI